MARPRSVTDQQLLDAARGVFLESGFGGSTIEIARRAGASEALLFKRFTSKEQLFTAALLTLEPPPWLDQLPRFSGIGEPRENLERIAELVLQWFMAIAPRLL